MIKQISFWWVYNPKHPLKQINDKIYWTPLCMPAGREEHECVMPSRLLSGFGALSPAPPAPVLAASRHIDADTLNPLHIMIHSPPSPSPLLRRIRPLDTAIALDGYSNKSSPTERNTHTHKRSGPVRARACIYIYIYTYLSPPAPAVAAHGQLVQQGPRREAIEEIQPQRAHPRPGLPVARLPG